VYVVVVTVGSVCTVVDSVGCVVGVSVSTWSSSERVVPIVSAVDCSVVAG